MSKTQENNIKQRLLDLGLEMFKLNGLRNLTVHTLCKEAGVNKGSFVYYFQNKQNFNNQILELWYAPLFHSFSIEKTNYSDPLVYLRLALIKSISFIHDNRQVVAQLFLDVINKEQATIDFVLALKLKHPRFFLEAIHKAQELKLIQAEQAEHILLFLLYACGAPVIFQTLLLNAVPLSLKDIKMIEELTIDIKQVEKRLDWALKGIQI